MQEIELKFQIPADALGILSAEIERLPGHGRERLQAHYFDTRDRRLGQARSALRLRKEGERWVQTLKAIGANTMVRLEHNQPAPAPPGGSAARIDLGLHRGSAVEASLVKVLDWQVDADPRGERTGLVELYRTDIWRHSARVSVGQGTAFEGVVELALDLGHIHAGELSLPVQELEIELAEGHAMAVILAGRDWVTRHGLWLDTRTKAHRGDRLARQAAGEAPPAPRRKTSDPIGLASLLEQATDAMSLVALGDGEVDVAVQHWREALLGLAVLQAQPTPEADMSAVTRLIEALERAPNAATELARAPSSTLLCLDLFANLL